MWLKPSRYFIIVVAILSHGILGTLSGGNIIFGGLSGLDLTTNVFTCLLGLPISIFLLTVVIAEHSQREETTTTLLFESLWVAVLWAANACAAALTSRGPPAKCFKAHQINWKWDVCVTYTLLVPAAWISFVVATVHVLVLTLLVHWHRERSPRRDQLSDTEGRNKLVVWIKDLVKDEMFIMAPLLGKSVYNLLQARSTAKASERHRSTRRHTLSLSKHANIDVEKSSVEVEQKSHPWSTGAKPKITSDIILSPFSEAPPAYLSPPPVGRHTRFDSNPDSLLTPILAMYNDDGRQHNVQLRDEPQFEILTVPPVVLSPRRTTPTSPFPPSPYSAHSPFYPSPSFPTHSPQLVPHSPLPPSPSPIAPRPPTRSYTLPTRSRLATPAQARHASREPSTEYQPTLTRSHTIASTRRFIPSRYADIDLVAAGYLNRLSIRFSTSSRPRSQA